MKNKGMYAYFGTSNYHSEERVKGDYYATDPKAMDLLLKHEIFDKNIWECACGGGNLSKRLIKQGYNVTSTDLYDRGYGLSGVDFLKQNKQFDGDIITNPPYKLATDFVLKALQLSKRKVAMFLRIQFLESQSRWDKLFSKYPPSVVYVSVKRIKCYSNGIVDNKSSAVCYAWFVWDKEYDGETKIRWLN